MNALQLSEITTTKPTEDSDGTGQAEERSEPPHMASESTDAAATLENRFFRLLKVKYNCPGGLLIPTLALTHGEGSSVFT